MEWYSFKNTEPNNLQEVKVKRVIDKTTISTITEEKIQTFDAKYFVYNDELNYWLIYSQGSLAAWRVKENDVWSPIQEKENENIETKKN